MGKMEYYATPVSVLERVNLTVKFPEGKVMVMDPWCGEGLAVNKLVEGVNVKTYGIELDKRRAEVIKLGLFNFRCLSEGVK